jgi:hypothetical protein
MALRMVEELSHGGDDGHLVGLSAGAKALVEGVGHRVVLDGDPGAVEEDLAHVVAPTLMER